MDGIQARRVEAGDAALGDVLALIRSEFAYMDGVIDPPSSMHRLTLDNLASGGEVWVTGVPVVACVVLTVKGDVLYVSKLAVAAGSRGKGHARALVDVAETRARTLGLGSLELQVRVELEGNQRAFVAMGFTETGRTAHPGYDRPTSVTMQRSASGKK
jgi:ribosomal protein S18 acetylase RimI-like enzyme